MSGFRRPQFNPTRMISILSRLALALFLLLSTGVAQAAPPRQDLAPGEPQAAPPVSPLNPIAGSAWGADGSVYASAIHGRTLYLGGDFANLCKPEGVFTVIDAETSLPEAGWPRITGGFSTINAILPDGAGGWFIGGSFNLVGGQSHPNFVHLLADKSVDPDWPSIDGVVNTLFRYDDTLYVGGSFSRVAGQARHLLAAVDATTGALSTTWTPEANDQVQAIVANSTTVFIGGMFSKINDADQPNLAAVSAANGDLITWVNTPNGAVMHLALSGSILFASGLFGTIGATPVNRFSLAAFNAMDGGLLSWDPQSGGFSPMLVVDGNTLFVSGMFTSLYGQPRARLASFWISDINASDGGITDWAPALTGAYPQTIAAGGNALYIGGTSMKANGEQRGPLAVVDASAAVTLPFNPDLKGSIYALASDGTHLAVGSAGNLLDTCMARANLAAIDLDTGEPLDWNPDANHEVDSMALDGNILYIGGNFTTIGGQTRTRLAAYDLLSGSLTAWSENFGASGHVRTIKVQGARIYVGGQFSHIGNDLHQYLASLNKTDGAADNSWNPGFDHYVDKVVSNTSTVFVGGRFNMANPGGPRACAASFISGMDTPTAWAPSLSPCIGDQFFPGVPGMALVNNTLYIGGLFTTISTTVRSHLAAFNIDDGSLKSWDPDADGQVYDLASGINKVLAGGNFSHIGGQWYRALAALDRTTGAAATNWNASVEGSLQTPSNVKTISVGGHLVCAGGDFESAADQPRNDFACFDMIAARTGAASDVTQHNVVLNGTATAFFMPGGHPTFQWGVEPGVYTATVPIPATPNSINVTSTVPVSGTLPGLLPEHTYYYRLVVTDVYGSAYGPMMQFTTGPTVFLPAVSVAK